MGLISEIEAKPTLRPPRIVVYAKGGVGKTTFAASVPGVLVLPAEEGEGILQYPKLPRPENYEDVINGIAELLQDKHDFKAYCIDTMDHIEPLVWDKVCRDKSAESKSREYRHIEDFGWAKGYTHSDPYWARILKGMDALRGQRKMTTIVLAHTETRTLEDPIHGAYDHIQTKLHKRANALLHEWADVVGYAEIERSVKTDDTGKREMRIATTTGRRVLHLEDRGGFFAKNRYALPSPIEFSYEALRDAIVQAFTDEKKREKTDAAA